MLRLLKRFLDWKFPVTGYDYFGTELMCGFTQLTDYSISQPDSSDTPKASFSRRRLIWFSQTRTSCADCESSIRRGLILTPTGSAFALEMTILGLSAPVWACAPGRVFWFSEQGWNKVGAELLELALCKGFTVNVWEDLATARALRLQ